MPLWAWHRPAPFLIAWTLVGAINSVHNNTTQAFATSTSSTVEHFRDLALQNLSAKENSSEGTTTSIADDSVSIRGRISAVTSSETTDEPDGTKNYHGYTEKDALENYGNQTPFGTKIRLADLPPSDEDLAKKATVLSPGPTLPSVLENNTNDSFGRKIQRDEPERADNETEDVAFKQNAIAQDEAIRNFSTDSTIQRTNTTLHSLGGTNSTASHFSSPENFTRAHLLPSLSSYDDDDDDILMDSKFFTRTTFPYGSRFYPKTSVFYRNLNSPDITHSRWTPDLWSSVYTTQWMEAPFASTCSSIECESGDTLGSAATYLSTPLFDNDPVSPFFFRTDRELWVNNYKGNTYIDPSHIATEAMRTKSRNQFTISLKGESEPVDVVTALDYLPLDEDFGMRITSTKVLSSVSYHTSSFYNNMSPERDRLSNTNAEITADNTIPVEFQKKTKDLENRHGFELRSSYSNSINANFHTNGGRGEVTVLKTNKWTAMKTDDGNTRGEISIQLGNTSNAVSTSSSDLILTVSINETIEHLSNSLLLLRSADIINRPNVSFENTGSKVIFSTPTISQDHSYNSLEILQAFNDTTDSTPISIESATGDNKSEIKYARGNISLPDTNYQKNAIDYNKEDKILKSSEQSTAQQHNSGYVTYSLKSRDFFQFSDSPVYDVYPSDSTNGENIPMYSGAFYTSVPFLVTSSEYDSVFGDRIFSKQSPSVTTFDMTSPMMISSVSVNDAAFSSNLLSSFYDMYSSYDQFNPQSQFAETPFMYKSLLDTDYLLSSSWGRELTEKSVLKEPEQDSEIISSATVEQTPVIFNVSTMVDPFSMHKSSILYFVSSSHPHLVSSLAGGNRTDVTASKNPSEQSSSFSTETTHQPPWDHKELNPSDEDVPPPRITNPSCTALPTCITMTIGMTWTEFCPVSNRLRKHMAESLSQIIKPIHAHQLVLSSDHHQCKTSGQENELISRRRRRRRRSEAFVEIRIFVVDHDGEYDEKLTEICGVILKKWMPTAGAPFQNKILAVTISHVGEETEETGIPETVPAESPTSTGSIAAITISTIAGACLFLVCILLVVMKQRLLQNRNCNPALDAYSLDSFSINASFRRRRVRQSMRSFLNHAFDDPELPSHPLNESGLVNCLKNTELLEEEFKKLPMNMPKLEQIPSGAEVKNRYANIVPNPDTRVPLSVSTEDPLKEYINANYVKGYDGKHRAYIATQAPLQETVNDFWQMVWEQQCKVVIMLTLLEENGVPRCAAYFPESTLDCHKLYGDFQVSLQKKDIREFYTMSTFRLFHLEKNLFREVAHFWYTAWPSAGVPSDPGYLVTFLLQARPFINANSGPTVVHCSPGTGRTGLILALDMSMKEFEQSRSVDLLRCIARIRKDRGGAVQTKEQYILLHEAVVEYTSYIANQSHRPSIRSND